MGEAPRREKDNEKEKTESVVYTEDLGVRRRGPIVGRACAVADGRATWTIERLPPKRVDCERVRRMTLLGGAEEDQLWARMEMDTLVAGRGRLSAGGGRSSTRVWLAGQ